MRPTRVSYFSIEFQSLSKLVCSMLLVIVDGFVMDLRWISDFTVVPCLLLFLLSYETNVLKIPSLSSALLSSLSLYTWVEKHKKSTEQRL